MTPLSSGSGFATLHWAAYLFLQKTSGALTLPNVFTLPSPMSTTRGLAGLIKFDADLGKYDFYAYIMFLKYSVMTISFK